MSKPKIVFVTQNEFGLHCLRHFHASGAHIIAILTLKKTAPYRDFARRHRIPLYAIKHINACRDLLERLKPDVLVVLWWSQLVSFETLVIPRWFSLGAHPSLLPRNRGRSAIPWHFINGEKYGGLTFFRMDERCDTGPIIEQERFRIQGHDTATTYYHHIERIAAKLIPKIVKQINYGYVEHRIQDHVRANDLRKRLPEESDLSMCRTPDEAMRLIRAMDNDQYVRAYLQTPHLRFEFHA